MHVTSVCWLLSLCVFVCAHSNDNEKENRLEEREDHDDVLWCLITMMIKPWQNIILYLVCRSATELCYCNGHWEIESQGQDNNILMAMMAKEKGMTNNNKQHMCDGGAVHILESEGGKRTHWCAMQLMAIGNVSFQIDFKWWGWWWMERMRGTPVGKGTLKPNASLLDNPPDRKMCSRCVQNFRWVWNWF